MKHWVFGLSLFFVTFWASVAVVVLTIPSSPTYDEIPAIADVTEITSRVTPSVPTEDFVPEFTNISVPDDDDSYADLEYGDLGGCTKDKRFKRSWLVFFKRGDRYSLERRKVWFGPRESDAWGGYYQMHFKDSKNSLFLLSDIGKLQPGPVKTFFLATDSGPYWDRTSAEPLNPKFRSEIFVETGEKPYHETIEFEKSQYTFRTAPATTKEGQRVTALIVESNTIQQPVYYDEVDSPPLGDIHWIGDMDGDSRMDFQFTFYAMNGGGSRSILFLSSLARKGELVRPYAFFFTRRYMECQ